MRLWPIIGPIMAAVLIYLIIRHLVHDVPRTIDKRR